MVHSVDSLVIAKSQKSLRNPDKSKENSSKLLKCSRVNNFKGGLIKMMKRWINHSIILKEVKLERRKENGLNFKKKRFKNLKIAQLMVDIDQYKRNMEFLADHYDTLVKISKYRKYVDKDGFVVVDQSTTEE